MARTTLGLDLGIASIGWALIREDSHKRDLVDWGSRVFEPGMDDDIASGKGVSRCAKRRQQRALRTQYARRKERKENLLDVFVSIGLLKTKPNEDFFVEVDQRMLHKLPVEHRTRMAHLIPYLYRKLALDNLLQPDELARAIYHLAQRRGYKSNRKQELKSADTGVVKSTISQLKEKIRKAGARTLGEYFCTVDPENQRIRGENHFTERKMFQEEFHKICLAQRHLISEKAEKKLYKAIFYQRPLKSSKHLIGRCRIYPHLTRCSFAKEEAQLFRIYTSVRNLRIDENGTLRSLTEKEHSDAVAFLNGFSPLFKKNGKIQLSKLQKAIGLPKTAKFTLADDEKEIYGNELNNILFRAFGNDAANISQQQRTLFLNDLASIRQEEVLRRRLRNFWNLSEERIEDVISIPIPDEFCAFSLKALKELLPDLKAGIDLNTILKVSHPQPPQAPMETLPLVDASNLDLRNPVVHRVMTELRRVINAIISRYGKPDKIRIELARDLKATNKERERIAYKNREQEKIRAKAAEKIVREVGISNPSKNDILKILLAEECNFVCPYSGETFELNDLFNGTLEIEHIIPYSRSFDDSFSNKTLCLRKYNLQKGNRSPYEAFGGSREYEDMLKRVSHFKGSYAERKLELFEAVEIDQEAFLSRNLNDTRYASKLAVQYLSCLYGGIVDKTGTQRIFATSGGCTALIRRAWGGNFLLGEGEKVRNDHRHHAIDALTIALTTPDLIKKIAALTPEQRRKRKEAKIFIDNELYQAAKEKLENIAVSHHQVNKLRGELHNETLYSHDFSDGQNERHVRVKLNALDCKTFSMIVDTEIQKLILEKLKVTDTKQLTDKMFSIFNDPQNYPTMKDRKGNIINTIKAVRVKKTQKTKTIGKGDGKREVANGVNHILAIFAKLDAEGNEISWEGEIVSLLDAVLRSKNGLPLFDKNRLDRKFKFSLQKGDIVSWEKDGIEHLCVIRGISLPQFSCVPINDARMQKELKAAKMWFTPTLSAAFKGGMKKFTMNIFGELQRAND